MKHWWNDTDRKNPKYSEKNPVPVLLCPAQNSHGLTCDLTWALAMISQLFIFYGDHVNLRHQRATTAATCSGLIRRKTWGSQNGVNEDTSLLDVMPCQLLNGPWISEVSYFVICGYCLYHPSQHCYGQYGFFSLKAYYCLKLYSISVQALVSLSLSKFVKTSHIENKMPRILKCVQYHNAWTEFHKNLSVALQAKHARR